MVRYRNCIVPYHALTTEVLYHNIRTMKLTQNIFLFTKNIFGTIISVPYL